MDKAVNPAPATSVGDAPISQSGLQTSANAPHIDSLSLIAQGHQNGSMFFVEEIGFHSPKGNAAIIHFDVISTSPNAPNIPTGDGKIEASSEQQQRGASYNGRFECSASAGSYSVVERAIIIDVDGEKSKARVAGAVFAVVVDNGGSPAVALSRPKVGLRTLVESYYHRPEAIAVTATEIIAAS